MGHLQLRVTVFLAVALLLAALFVAPQLRPVEGAGQTFYVSRLGSNGDGRSWATAWNELSQIAWAAVQPGDTVLIDGGGVACPRLGPGYNCGMVYNSALDIDAAGSNGAPISVRLADEPGRNGTVIIDGGITAWSGCAENAPEPTPPSVTNGAAPRQTGIDLGDSQWIVIDGGKWGGIEVRNHTRYGLGLSGSQHVTARYLKLHHNTDPVDTTNGAAGVTQNYRSQYNTLSRVEIFRNGQDAIRGAGDFFTVEESYLHDHYCNHPDGIQSFVPTGNTDVPDDAGEVRGLVVRRNVFDKIGLQTIFLGENGAHQSWNLDVTIQDNLFLNSMYPIKSKHARSTNWSIVNNTFMGATNFGVQWCCANPGAVAPMLIANNVFVQVVETTTAFYLPTGGGTTSFTDNCLHRTGKRSGNVTDTGSITADPLFVNPPAGAYALAAGSPCAGKGSSLTSVDQLLALSGAASVPGNAPTDVPAATATDTAAPTATTMLTPSATSPATDVPPPATSTSTETVVATATETADATSQAGVGVPTATHTPDLPAATETATDTAAPPTPTASDTATATNTHTATTAAPTGTATNTHTATSQPPTATATATRTATATNTSTTTQTATATATWTATATATRTATATATRTSTATASWTPVIPTPTRTSAAATATLPVSQTLTLAPVADAYVDAAARTTNYGSSIILRTQSLPGQRAYLRFNVTGVAGRPVVRAYLRIFVNKSTTLGFRVHSVSNNSWAENTVNFNNAPTVGAVLASSGAHSGSAWVQVDVTSYITGDGTYSLAMTTTNTDSVTYASRNATSNRPQLILTLGR